jgi:single-strand DNA-binding protein
MSSLNKILLIGNLGKDPEVRYTPDGTPVATFSLATSENWTDKSGGRQEHTEWHTIVAWSRLADLAKRFLSKGRQVYIEGRIRSRDWTDKDGNKRRTTEVIASQMVLLGSRPQGAEASYAPADTASRAPAEPDQFADSGINDSDIPF